MLSDAVVAVGWLVANGLLLSSVWSIACKLFPRDRLIERIQHAIILAWSTVVLAAIVLSLPGWLSGAGLLLLVSLLSAGTLFGIHAWTSSSNRQGRCRRDAAGYSGSSQFLWNCLWCVAAAWLLARLSLILAIPVYPYCWDTLSYHLPFVDHWLHAGSLYAPTAMKWFFPGNSEILALWMTGAFSGNFFAVLSNIPIFRQPPC